MPSFASHPSAEVSLTLVRDDFVLRGDSEEKSAEEIVAAMVAHGSVSVPLDPLFQQTTKYGGLFKKVANFSSYEPRLFCGLLAFAEACVRSQSKNVFKCLRALVVPATAGRPSGSEHVCGDSCALPGGGCPLRVVPSRACRAFVENGVCVESCPFEHLDVMIHDGHSLLVWIGGFVPLETLTIFDGQTEGLFIAPHMLILLHRDFATGAHLLKTKLHRAVLRNKPRTAGKAPRDTMQPHDSRLRAQRN